MNIREIGIKDRKAIRYLHVFANKDLNLVLSLKTRFRLNSKGISKLTKLKRIYLPLGEIQYEMIYVPSGFFEMGSNDVVPSVKYQQIANLLENASPKHQVQITRGFFMGSSQVTNELWYKIMGWVDTEFHTLQFDYEEKLVMDLYPMIRVSWYDSLLFCNKLSDLLGYERFFVLDNIEKGNGDEVENIKKADVRLNRNANGFRLPTEAEWEYAAKAGTDNKYSGSNILSDVGTVDDLIFAPQQIKLKKPNEWGFYDMSGNAYDLCLDLHETMSTKDKSYGTAKFVIDPLNWILNSSNASNTASIVRGGDVNAEKGSCLNSYRDFHPIGGIIGCDGFRVVRNICF